ncbi:MAG: response regulator, partial [Deltaproteobacteria bacterium]|nr:response regulator [Deltaproteobacteria bacterium]
MEELSQATAILIVEDDKASRLGLFEFVKLEGYSVFEADTVNTALNILNSNNNIGIIITDLKLPDGTGLD